MARKSALQADPASPAAPASSGRTDAAGGGKLRGEEALGTSKTGLGVAGMLRRIGLWAGERPEHGEIRIDGREVARWIRAEARCAPARQAGFWVNRLRFSLRVGFGLVCGGAQRHQPLNAASTAWSAWRAVKPLRQLDLRGRRSVSLSAVMGCRLITGWGTGRTGPPDKPT